MNCEGRPIGRYCRFETCSELTSGVCSVKRNASGRGPRAVGSGKRELVIISPLKHSDSLRLEQRLNVLATRTGF